MTAENNSLYNSLPSLNETYWTYEKGASQQQRYACKFHSSSQSAEGYSYWDCSYIGGRFDVTRRRLVFDDVWFVWNGSCYISKDQYDSPSGKINYFLRPDPSRKYDELETAGHYSGAVCLPDGDYYVELESYSPGDPIVVNFYRYELLGYHENGNPILQSTGEYYSVALSPGCTVLDSSVLDSMGISIMDYTDLGTLWSRYGAGTVLLIEVRGGVVTRIDKLYLA